MFKFFRRIRQRLFSESRFTKYLFYALGELLLVVMGILIALQVNNWNELRKIEIRERSDLIKLKIEFDKNFKEFEWILETKKKDFKEWNVWINKVVNNELDKEKSLRRKSTSSWTFTPVLSTYNKLIFTGSIDNIKNDSLRNMLNSWQFVLDEYKEDEDFHGKFLREQLYPYELGIIPSLGPLNDSVQNPFYSKMEQDQLSKSALADLKYQNILLRNMMWIDISIDEGTILLNNMQAIIELLESEIELRGNSN